MCPSISHERPDEVTQRTDRVQPTGFRKKIRLPRLTKRRLSILAVVLVVTVAVPAGVLSRGWWLPKASRLLTAIGDRSDGQKDGHDVATDDQGQADAHVGHSAGTSLQMSEQARKNVGLKLVTIEPRDFARTIAVPAMIAERPGRTQIKVSAPMTGIVTRVYPIRGEAVRPGQPLFDLRLTHEDLVQTQSEFLQTVERLDVIRDEITRIEDLAASGAIAGKELFERQYEQRQAEALLRAQRQGLILHGLTEQQVETIQTTRRLIPGVTIPTPEPASGHSIDEHEELLQVAELAVTPGEHVETGARLCTLADYCELYIEGRAFEQDAPKLTEAANRGTPVTAIIEQNGNGTQTVSDLPILYVENEVERDSRALLFYVPLPNKLVRNETTANGHRFIGWQYKPGQRVELRIPVETWENRIVLPVDAVVKEGVDWFVFQQNGDHFDLRPVHVEYRDQLWAVIENDGTLFPGDVVAASGAYQMHLALKNKAGGGGGGDDEQKHVGCSH